MMLGLMLFWFLIISGLIVNIYVLNKMMKEFFRGQRWRWFVEKTADNPVLQSKRSNMNAFTRTMGIVIAFVLVGLVAAGIFVLAKAPMIFGIVLISAAALATIKVVGWIAAGAGLVTSWFMHIARKEGQTEGLVDGFRRRASDQAAATKAAAEAAAGPTIVTP